RVSHRLWGPRDPGRVVSVSWRHWRADGSAHAGGLCRAGGNRPAHPATVRLEITSESLVTFLRWRVQQSLTFPMSSSLPLSGRRIAVTRAREQAPELTARLTAL